VTAARTWQDKAATAGIVLLTVGVCLFAIKCLSFRALYGRHDNFLVASSEAGLIADVIAFILILFDRRTVRRVILAIASLVLSYLFLSGIAWWVMVK
jgi:hypothetical protein